MLYYVCVRTKSSIRKCLVQAPNGFVAVMYVILHDIQHPLRTEIRNVEVEPFYVYQDRYVDGYYSGFYMYTVPKDFEYNPGGTNRIQEN
jgi:hypothetical protein